jgi:hypothetical protein
MGKYFEDHLNRQWLTRFFSPSDRGSRAPISGDLVDHLWRFRFVDDDP